MQKQYQQIGKKNINLKYAKKHRNLSMKNISKNECINKYNNN